MEEVITVDLGLQNGTHTFKSLDRLKSWLISERDKWEWMSPGEPGNSANRVQSRFSQLQQQIISWEVQGQPFSIWRDNLPGFFHPHNEGILLADTEMGRQVVDVRDAYGDLAGAVAYSALQGWITLGHLDRLELVRPYLAAAMPSLLNPERLASTLKAERTKSAKQLRLMLQEAEAAEENRAAVCSGMLEEARRRTVSWTRKTAVAWNRRRNAGNAAQDAAINTIRNVTKTYDEFMKLQAPANYWREKAERHGVAESKARGLLFVFFPLALATLLIIFVATAWVLLQPGPAHPTPVYFVISAGLATFAGVVFWIGRLLTRLYLSEHHLRKDAEEREVMTTTYLALTGDEVADEKDRHIVLAALFRNSADGIVKDDGGANPDLASLIAKIGTGR